MCDSPANPEDRCHKESPLEDRPSPSIEASEASSKRRRIETQIHRRKKAKAVPPLEAEWNEESPGLPANLRTSSDKMEKTREHDHKSR